MNRVIVVIAVCLCAGCSREVPVVPVAGQLLQSGKPLGGIMVTFAPVSDVGAGLVSRGATDDAGRFTMQCSDGRAGVVPGRYRIILEDLAVFAADRSEKATAPPPPSRVGVEYASAETTPLDRDVVSPEPDFQFEVPRPALDR